MMSMRSKHRPSQTSTSGPSRYDRMAAPGHISTMNTKVNWAEFVAERERGKSGHQLPAIPAGTSLDSSFRKRNPLSTADLASSSGFTILPEIEGIDIDKELRESLSGPLQDVSRQRLRAIKISFRRLSNMDNRISTKDVLVVLSEHNVKITNRTYQMIVRKFETERGMDIDGLWNYMAEAQARTGRDSIQAINQNKPAAAVSHPLQQPDEEDIALLANINKALQSSNEYDLQEMRSVCQARDISRQGVLPRKMFRRICLDQHIPLGAALMRSMLKRCDDEKNGLISWPEFLMLLEKGVNFDPELYKTKKKVPLAIHRPKKPASPKSHGHLLPGDAKHKEVKDSGRASGRINGRVNGKVVGKARPKSSNGLSQDAQSKSSPEKTNDESLKKESRETSEPTSVVTTSTNRSLQLPAVPGTDKEEKEISKADSQAGAKTAMDSDRKPSSKEEKETAKANIAEEEATKDAPSVLSQPTQRKSKAITWNDPITIPPKADQLSAKTNQEPIPTADTTGKIKTEKPADKPEVITRSNETSDESAVVETKNGTSPKQDEASLTSDKNQNSASQSTDKVVITDSNLDPTEEEYLNSEQERLNRIGSEITLNEPSIDSISIVSEKDCNLTNQDNPGDPPLQEDRSDRISPAPSEKIDIRLGDTDASESNGNEKHDGDRSDAASVVDKDDVDTWSLTSPSLPSKPKNLKLLASAQKRMRSVYGKNPRNQLTPLTTRGRDRKTQPNRTTTLGKAQSTAKSTEAKRPKMKSSSASTKNISKNNTTAPAATTPVQNRCELLKTPDPAAETKSLVSQSSVDSQDSILANSPSSASLITSAVSMQDDGDLISRHLQEVEKVNRPALEGASSPTSTTPLNDDPVEESALPPSREDDGEKATFKIRGQEVTYYKPDVYVGKEPPTDIPSQNLELDWIYGYRGNDCRCNMYVIENGVLAYFIGKVAVLYNTSKHSQRHYTAHTAEIRSLAVHSSNVILATGQTVGPKDSGMQACIHVWSAETLETLYTAGEGYFENAVVCLSFCIKEDYLVAVDDSEEHTMSVWQSSSGERLADKVLLTEVACQVAFHPTRPHNLVSVGKEHLCFWRLLKEPYTIEETMIANYETKMKAKYVICFAFHPNGALLTGDSNGTIYLWHKEGNTIVHSITHAHDGPVFWLMYVKNTLFSGGRDGIVQTYSLSSKGTDYTGKLKLPSVEGGVRAIQLHKDKMFIGTTLNCILSANITWLENGPVITGTSVNNAPITQGHYDEVRCIVPHPTKDQHFFTAAYDGIICLYDASLHKAIWKYVVKGINTMCVDINVSGQLMILGAKDGHLVVLSIGEEEVQEINRIKLGRQPLSFIKFAPGGEIFAASCNDLILILKTTDGGKTVEPMGKCQGHLSKVTGFDWSKDKNLGRFLLQSSSLSHEYMCWDVDNFQPLEYSSEYRNVSWNSHNCTSGFNVAGVWGTCEESPVVNAIDRSEDQCLLATGTDDGMVSLYKYPCTNQQGISRSVCAHCQVTPCVRFLHNKTLLSAGGPDCTTIQWTLQE